MAGCQGGWIDVWHFRPFRRVHASKLGRKIIWLVVVVVVVVVAAAAAGVVVVVAAAAAAAGVVLQ